MSFIRRILPSSNQGFTLPVILLISIGLMVIGLSLVQSTSSVRNTLTDQYFNRMASEAAESGAVYANFCLAANSFYQTWGSNNSKPDLTQQTDCSGSTLSSAPTYLMTNGNFHTSFTVGNLEQRSDGAIILSAVGKAQQMRGSSATQVARELTITRKQVVNWKTYRASVSASGTSKTCAIVSNELYCWGKNSNGGETFGGQLGNGTTTDSLVPVKVTQAPGVLANKVVDDVASAQYHSCALAEGKVYCWGQNDNGQLGNGTTTDSSVPVEVQGTLAGKTVTAVSTSGNTSCAIAQNKIYCWGWNTKGTVGVGVSGGNYTSPTAVATGGANGLPSTYSATALSTSGSRSYNMCAIADDKAYCWGNNEAGQIGNGTSGATNVTSPTKVTDTGVLAGKTVTAISQDGYYGGPYTHVCAVASGAVYCWGENNVGQLGRDSGGNRTTDSNVPVAVYAGGVLSGKTVQDVAVGLQHSCALANSKVYCWGTRTSGQVGDDSNFSATPVYVPVAVAEQAGGLLGKTVTSIGGGANRGCALADFQAFCWGLNTDGQLGDNTQTNRDVPTESIFLRPKAPAFIF